MFTINIARLCSVESVTKTAFCIYDITILCTLSLIMSLQSIVFNFSEPKWMIFQIHGTGKKTIPQSKRVWILRKLGMHNQEIAVIIVHHNL